MKTFFGVFFGIIGAIIALFLICSVGSALICKDFGADSAKLNNVKKSVSSQKKSFEIVSIKTKVTESNNVYKKFSWILKLKNLSNQTQKFEATIKWVDKDGFVVDDDVEFNLIVGALVEKSFNGSKLITMPSAKNVSGIEAEAKLSW